MEVTRRALQLHGVLCPTNVSTKQHCRVQNGQGRGYAEKRASNSFLRELMISHVDYAKHCINLSEFQVVFFPETCTSFFTSLSDNLKLTFSNDTSNHTIYQWQG